MGGDTIAINEELQLPADFNLTAYPNPFNGSVNLKITIPQSQDTKIDLYDILGRKLKGVLHERLECGYYAFHYDAAALGINTSGQYFLVMDIGSQSVVSKVTYLK